MFRRRQPLLRSLAAVAVLACLGGARAAHASDHDDTPLLKAIPRHDARITDLHAFVVDGRLVLSLCVDPTVPAGVASYAFADDLKLEIAVDNDSLVTFDDPGDLTTYGGTIPRPERIRPDLTFEVTFEDGIARLRTKGLSAEGRASMKFFVGLRDDPFIRGPRIGRNVAAVVIEVPLESVLDNQPTLLIWARSDVRDVRGPIADLGARSLRSQMPENLDLNTLPPRLHKKKLGLVPDVIIYDTSRPAAFPNGRALTDDVVDLVGDTRILANDTPFPSENDVPFLHEFPWLAPPQLPPP